MAKSGIAVECVDAACKKRKTLDFDAASKLDGSPICECGCVMVVTGASISTRRSGRDIRPVMARLTSR